MIGFLPRYVHLKRTIRDDRGSAGSSLLARDRRRAYSRRGRRGASTRRAGKLPRALRRLHTSYSPRGSRETQGHGTRWRSALSERACPRRHAKNLFDLRRAAAIQTWKPFIVYRMPPRNYWQSQQCLHVPRSRVRMRRWTAVRDARRTRSRTVRSRYSSLRESPGWGPRW